MRRFLPVLLCALLLVGCGAGTGGLESMTYTYRGGLMGYDRELSIKRNGSYTSRNRTETTQEKLTRAERKALERLLAAVPWAALDAEYSNPTLADAVVERIDIIYRERTYHVLAATGGAPPLELRRVLDLLAKHTAP